MAAGAGFCGSRNAGASISGSPAGNSSSTTNPAAAAAATSAKLWRLASVSFDAARATCSAEAAFSSAPTAASVSSLPFEKIMSDGEDVLIAADVGPRPRVHLREVLDRSRGGVDAAWASGEMRGSAQRGQALFHGGQRRGDARGPEILALSGGDVGLLRGAQLEDAAARRARLRVEDVSGSRLGPPRDLALPEQICGHAERQHEQHE